MPELPEVETIVRDLQDRLLGRSLRRAQVFWPRTLATGPIELFNRQIAGQSIRTIHRRAKYIVLNLNLGQVLIHLRMTGKLYFCEPSAPRDKHEHVLLDLDDGSQLRFQDPRKFGRWYYFAEGATPLDALGPEPLDRSLSPALFSKRLRTSQRQLKPLLLDQGFIAGLGNIYVDEALWEAQLHPERRASTLNELQARTLLKSIRKVLRRGIRNLGTTLGKSNYNYYSVGGRRGRNQDALKVFRKTGEPCPRCEKIIQRIIVGQRSTHLCPKCQRVP